MINSSKSLSLFINTPGGKRPLTDLEKCMLLILRNKKEITSRDILKSAKKIKVCASCSDHNQVFTTGERLLKKGLIKRALLKKEYSWCLTEKGDNLAQKI